MAELILYLSGACAGICFAASVFLILLYYRLIRTAQRCESSATLLQDRVDKMRAEFEHTLEEMAVIKNAHNDHVNSVISVIDEMKNSLASVQETAMSVQSMLNTAKAATKPWRVQRPDTNP